MTKRQNTIAVLLIAIAFLLSFSVCASAADDLQSIDCTEAAEKLGALGVFRGTDKGFELDRPATRAEMLVMILRLLGQENAALSSKAAQPFDDAGWADRYIAYGYEQKLILGMSEKHFGTTETATAGQFCTMLLRAMGYADGRDFVYDTVCDTANGILFCDIQNGLLNRGEMAYISYRALAAKMQTGDRTLAESLIEKQVFTDKQYADTFKKYATTTVMIYMVASDLESERGMATKDISEMLAADESENVRVLLQCGGTNYWQNNYFADGKVQRAEIKDKTLSAVEILDSTEMLKSDSLADFIGWCAKRAPAERYILILWDHGKGTMGGFGKDEVTGGDAMRLYEIREALQKADVHFAAVGFDACLMASFETAYALRGYADFLIGAEDISAYSGWYYTTFLNTLVRTPGISTLHLSKLICDSHVLRADSLTTAISVLDLSGAEIVYQKLLALADGDLLRQANAGLHVCGQAEGGYDQYDLVQLLAKIPQARDALYAAERMIVYARRGALNGYSNGLALYLPSEHPERMDEATDDLLKIGFEEKYIKNINQLNEGEES